MKLELEMNHSDIVYKESGEVPEEYLPYVFVWENHRGEYAVLVGFYQSWYDEGKGAVYDGIGAHLDWSEVIAWKCLDGIKAVGTGESYDRQGKI